MNEQFNESKFKDQIQEVNTQKQKGFKILTDCEMFLAKTRSDISELLETDSRVQSKFVEAIQEESSIFKGFIDTTVYTLENSRRFSEEMGTRFDDLQHHLSNSSIELQSYKEQMSRSNDTVEIVENKLKDLCLLHVDMDMKVSSRFSKLREELGIPMIDCQIKKLESKLGEIETSISVLKENTEANGICLMNLKSNYEDFSGKLEAGSDIILEQVRSTRSMIDNLEKKIEISKDDENERLVKTFTDLLLSVEQGKMIHRRGCEPGTYHWFITRQALFFSRGTTEEKLKTGYMKLYSDNFQLGSLKWFTIELEYTPKDSFLILGRVQLLHFRIEQNLKEDRDMETECTQYSKSLPESVNLSVNEFQTMLHMRSENTDDLNVSWFVDDLSYEVHSDTSQFLRISVSVVPESPLTHSVCTTVAGSRSVSFSDFDINSPSNEQINRMIPNRTHRVSPSEYSCRSSGSFSRISLDNITGGTECRNLPQQVNITHTDECVITTPVLSCDTQLSPGVSEDMSQGSARSHRVNFTRDSLHNSDAQLFPVRHHHGTPVLVDDSFVSNASQIPRISEYDATLGWTPATHFEHQEKYAYNDASYPTEEIERPAKTRIVKIDSSSKTTGSLNLDKKWVKFHSESID